MWLSGVDTSVSNALNEGITTVEFDVGCAFAGLVGGTHTWSWISDPCRLAIAVFSGPHSHRQLQWHSQWPVDSTDMRLCAIAQAALHRRSIVRVFGASSHSIAVAAWCHHQVMGVGLTVQLCTQPVIISAEAHGLGLSSVWLEVPMTLWHVV